MRNISQPCCEICLRLEFEKFSIALRSGAGVVDLWFSISFSYSTDAKLHIIGITRVVMTKCKLSMICSNMYQI